MKIVTEKIRVNTKGAGDLVDITDKLKRILGASRMKDGQLTAFVVGSTAAITTFEYESGLAQDMRDLYEKIAPANKHYSHDDTWGDANGFSHVRAALQGPSVAVPFEAGRLMLGTWQQVVLAEFDNQQRDRQIIVQLMGE
ncbi:MAG: YjbQ family protein [Candidatus Omnitrophica bacterium]|nr:YjbQ family protein [Candidatus Omnitrophota bacterium]